MTTPNSLPLPGDVWDRTDDYSPVLVIASQWGNDSPEDGPIWYVLLMLNPTPPHYEVVEVVIEPKGRGYYEALERSHGTRMNINEAVALYAEMGGDQ